MEQKSIKTRIRYNGLLDKVFVFYCKNNPELKKMGWNDWMPPTKEEVIRQVQNYKKEWKKYEKDILNELSVVLDLKFQNPIIDVHIVSGNPRQIGDPIVIRSGFNPEEFVSTLTHELVHHLCSINNIEELDEYLEKPYITESSLTRRHIIVLAALTHIYKNILKDEKELEHSKSRSEKHSTKEYTLAWNIVDELGYANILDKFRTNRKRRE